MLFLVKVELFYKPCVCPISGSTSRTIGMINADSEEDAARQLGLTRWPGWERILAANKDNREKKKGEYFFLKEDTEKIDANPQMLWEKRGGRPNLRGVTFELVEMITKLDPTKTFMADLADIPLPLPPAWRSS